MHPVFGVHFFGADFGTEYSHGLFIGTSHIINTGARITVSLA